MESIKQRSIETLEQFINRALREKTNTEDDYILIFNDGIQLTTENYHLDDNNAIEELKENYELKRKSDKGKKTKFITATTYTHSEDDKNSIGNAEQDNTIILPTSKLNTSIANPLRFLLEASNKKYKSDENRKRLGVLQQQLEQLNKNKERLIQKIVQERDIDLHTSAIQREEVHEIEEDQLEIIKFSADIKMNQMTHILVEQLKKYTEKLEAAQAKKERITKESQHSESYTLQTQLSKINQTISNYMDYIELLKSSITEQKEEIAQLQQDKSQVKKKYKSYYKQLLADITTKYGCEVVNGKTITNFENIPEIAAMNQSIYKVEKEIARLERNPEEIYLSIKAMMESKESPRIVAEEVHLLGMTIHSSNIAGILEKDQTEYQSIEVQLQRLERQLEKKEKEHEESNYFDQRAMVDDQKEISILQKSIENSMNKLRILELELKRYEEQKNLPKLQRHLEVIDKAIQSSENFINLLKNPTDTDIYLQPNIGELVDAESELYKFKYKKNVLEARINNILKQGRIQNPRRIRNNCINLQQEIREQQVEIEMLQQKKYLDIEGRKKNIEAINSLKQQIYDLRQQQEYLGNHTVAQLEESILKDYERTLDTDNLFEQIETYENPENNLLEKIRSSRFKEKALEAIHQFFSLRNQEESEFVQKEEDMLAKKVVETSPQIEENETDFEEVASIVETSEKEKEIEGLESMLEKALEEYVTESDNLVIIDYNNIPEQREEINNPQAVSDNHFKEQKELWNIAEVGKYYAIVDGTPIAIPLDKAEEYLEQGIEVVTPFEIEGGSIDFLHLDFPEGKVR